MVDQATQTGLNGLYSSTVYRPINNPKEGIDFASEHDFHTLYTENEGAGVILQGFVRMVDGCESYSYVHQFLTPLRIKSFLAAFHKTATGETIPELWEELRALFGMTSTKEADKAAKERSDKAAKEAGGGV